MHRHDGAGARRHLAADFAQLIAVAVMQHGVEGDAFVLPLGDALDAILHRCR